MKDNQISRMKQELGSRTTAFHEAARTGAPQHALLQMRCDIDHLRTQIEALEVSAAADAPHHRKR